MTVKDQLIPNCSRKRSSTRCVLDEHMASFVNLERETVRQLCKSFPLVQSCSKVCSTRLQTLMTVKDQLIPNCARKRSSTTCVLNEHVASIVNLKWETVRQLCRSFPLVQSCSKVCSTRLETLMTVRGLLIPSRARTFKYKVCFRRAHGQFC